mmetsp:Transcript_5109/g.19134  ORF Transcript_5109/g.19134 Transcript_5109/m.19134 type:complete len:210 (-) Transcript_5109:1260-1889(-)
MANSWFVKCPIFRFDSSMIRFMAGSFGKLVLAIAWHKFERPCPSNSDNLCSDCSKIQSNKGRSGINNWPKAYAVMDKFCGWKHDTFRMTSRETTAMSGESSRKSLANAHETLDKSCAPKACPITTPCRANASSTGTSARPKVANAQAALEQCCGLKSAACLIMLSPMPLNNSVSVFMPNLAYDQAMLTKFCGWYLLIFDFKTQSCATAE